MNRRWGPALAAGLLAWTLGATAAAAAATAVAAPPTSPGVLPATLDPGTPFVVLEELAVLVPQIPAVRVDELIDAVNRGSKAVSGVRFTLPPHAIGVSATSGAAAGTVAGGAVTFPGSVAPGATANYDLTYTLSWDGGQLFWPVAYPTVELSLLLPRGAWRLSGPGFTAAGPTRVAGSLELDAYTTLAPTSGAVLPLRVAAVPLWGREWVRLTLAALLLAALLLGAARGLRRRRARLAQAESELIDAVARLDLARARGEVAEQAYQQQRQVLLAELRERTP